jgi:hypothetical protein
MYQNLHEHRIYLFCADMSISLGMSNLLSLLASSDQRLRLFCAEGKLLVPRKA